MRWISVFEGDAESGEQQDNRREMSMYLSSTVLSEKKGFPSDTFSHIMVRVLFDFPNACTREEDCDITKWDFSKFPESSCLNSAQSQQKWNGTLGSAMALENMAVYSTQGRGRGVFKKFLIQYEQQRKKQSTPSSKLASSLHIYITLSEKHILLHIHVYMKNRRARSRLYGCRFLQVIVVGQLLTRSK